MKDWKDWKDCILKIASCFIMVCLLLLLPACAADDGNNASNVTIFDQTFIQANEPSDENSSPEHLISDGTNTTGINTNNMNINEMNTENLNSMDTESLNSTDTDIEAQTSESMSFTNNSSFVALAEFDYSDEVTEHIAESIVPLANDFNALTNEENSFSVSACNIYTPSYSEDSYMHNVSYYLSVLPPDGYDEENSQTSYPSFKKYTYYSTTRGRYEFVNILLPRNYSLDKKYPVAYILHGYGNTEDGMAIPEMALIQILTNLQEHGQATDMIIVLPYVYCSSEHHYDPGLTLESLLAYDNFINDLRNDLMPFIEEHFPAATGKENTAITGFSMGGREAMFIGFMHPDEFGFVGAVAPAPGLVPVEDSELRPGQMQPYQMRFGDEKPYLFLISSSKADGAVRETPDEYRKILVGNKVGFLSHIMEDAFHNETVVKPHLYMFFKSIFK